MIEGNYRYHFYDMILRININIDRIKDFLLYYSDQAR